MIPVSAWNKKSLVHSSSFKSDKLQALPNTALVGGALAFVLRFSRFFGTAPLRFKREHNCWRVQVCPAMCVYSYVFIITLNIIVYSALVMDASVPASNSIRLTTDATVTVWIMDLVIVTLISVYGIVSGPSQMKQLIVYLNHINMIFSDMNNGYIIQKPEQLRCRLIVLYVFVTICVCTGDLMTFRNVAIVKNKSITTFWMYALYYIEVVILCLLELQFILSAMLSHTAFQCVNEELAALIIKIDLKTSANHNRITILNGGIVASHPDVSISPYAVNVKTYSVANVDNGSFSDSSSLLLWSYKIRRLSLAFSLICDGVRRLDKSNGFLVLLLLLSFLIHLVETPYYLINFLLEKRREFMMQVFWSILHASMMVMIVEPGHRIQKEVIWIQQEMAKTQVLIGQLMNRASAIRDPVIDDLNIFKKQIILNPVVFSPLGICTLSRPLIASILGAVTTYLVVLVQFQKSQH